MPFTGRGAAQALAGTLTVADRYVSLHSTAPPTAANELAALNGYARARAPRASWNIADAVATTTEVITFPNPTGAWLAPRATAITVAAIGGVDDLLVTGPLTGQPRVPVAGDTVSFPIGLLTMTIALTSLADLARLVAIMESLKDGASQDEYEDARRIVRSLLGAHTRLHAEVRAEPDAADSPADLPAT